MNGRKRVKTYMAIFHVGNVVEHGAMQHMATQDQCMNKR